MKSPLSCLTLLLVCGSLISCDRVKEIALQASSAVTRGLENQAGRGGKSVDRSLQQLVDQNEQGYLFRKDLPFPTKVSMQIRVQRDMSGRFFHASELGRKVENVKGTDVTVSELFYAKGQLRYQLKESSYVTNPTEKLGGDDVLQAAKNPMRQIELSMEPLVFERVGGSWNPGGAGGFRSMVIARELAPVFDELLIENALSPRPLWFSSKKRINIGDELDVVDSAIPMLVAGKANGKLHLRFEAVEAVNGHPCGVFYVVGNYQRKGFPSFDGQMTDQEVTIESGRMWFSLIYPVILKQELQTLESLHMPNSGGLVEVFRGMVKTTITRDWVAHPDGR